MKSAITDTVDNSSNPGNSVDMLDVVLILVKSIRIMVAVPIFGFLIVLGFYFMLPARFESEAVIRMPIETTLQLQSTSFLDEVVQTNQWLVAQYDKQYKARENFKRSLRVTNISGTDIYRLQYAADTPEHAEEALSSILKQLLAASKPLPGRQEELRAQLLSQTTLQQALYKSLERLNDPNPDEINTSVEGLAQSVVAIGAAIEKSDQVIAALEKSLKGSVSTADILQSPTHPDEPLAKGAVSKAVGVAAVMFFIMLMWAFVREAFQRAASDKSGQNKIQNVKSLLWARRK